MSDPQVRALENPPTERPQPERCNRIRPSRDDRWNHVALAAQCKAGVADIPEALRRDVPRSAALLERAGNAYHLASSAYGALCHGDDEHARALVAGAIPLTRALDSPYVWMLLSGNAGLAALFTGHLDEARDAFREELAVCREIVVLPFASEGLAGLAAIETVDGDLDRAARLCGASRAHRRATLRARAHPARDGGPHRALLVTP